MSLTGKVAIVTGAGSGIGRGISIELARRGVKVAVNYNSSDIDDGALETKRQIDEAGGECCIVKANVADKREVESMVQAVVKRYGSVDILVNNAAVQLNYTLFEHTEESYDLEMNVNLKGYWLCIQAAAPYMKARRFGRIINICSVHGKRPTDFDTVYSMTKGGVKMLARESAIELGRFGITVNNIEPGAIDVGKGPIRRQSDEPGITGGTPEKREKPDERLIRKFPLGRVGRPADIAHMVCHIASEEAEFMNGASIRLDGASMLL
ncbi:SDR family NAD(P)-dependent oxidoreductase [Paenibacillus thalictri]|uniref:SDR family oxidoreductase n=1 Tax=Paenibacillus thalictri TaxID=2527873 RepID=A0A4Q9DL31_9BACL|nr:SDR family oxidoreductase [Paenibacillus thalictri]TBL71601.1 SDR family oxidoreductase [Paenibacillus thalictri]